MKEFYGSLTYENLLKPGSIGQLKTRNRVIMAPMGNNLASANGEVSDDLIAYYTARAKGGVGTIIVESTCIEYPRGSNGAIQLRIDGDIFIPGLSKLAECIKQYGARAIIQISHSGGNAHNIPEGITPVAPSRVPYRTLENFPRELDLEEITELIDLYNKAAVRAKRAGFDGVEIHGAHAYLVAQFLSPVMNLRKDDYGGTTMKRARFALEIVRKIRQSVGKEFAILFRISGDEFLINGRQIEETIEIVKALEEEGIDGIHVSAGANRFGLSKSSAITIEPSNYPEGWKAYLAAAIKKEISIPVITVGVIRTPVIAEEILSNGYADYVALGRALLADPNWVAKVEKGESELICPCISCRVGCSRNRTFLSRQLRCAVNPLTGREHRIQNLNINPTHSKRIAVVGGGLAGISFAILATKSGHDVELFERNSQIVSGQLRLAVVPPGKQKINWLIKYLEAEASKLPFKISLNTEITENNSDVLDSFGVVVMATGSKTRQPENYGLNSFISSDEFLIKPTKFLIPKIKKVVISGGGAVACEIALMAAQGGVETVLVTQRNRTALAQDMEPLSRYELICQLKESQVIVKDRVNKREVLNSKCLRIRQGDLTEDLIADLYIASTPRYPNMNIQLVDALRQKGIKVYSIGDSAEIGKIMETIHDAYHLAIILNERS
ncbi:MAG: FAD-dependent oxidoreductase [Desulfitobacterium sp.]